MKYLKERWELLLGFFIAVLGTLFLSNRKQNKTSKKLNKLDREKNKEIEKISKERIEAHEKIIKKHEKTFKRLAEEESEEISANNKKAKDYKKELDKKSNQEIADLFNKDWWWERKLEN